MDRLATARFAVRCSYFRAKSFLASEKYSTELGPRVFCWQGCARVVFVCVGPRQSSYRLPTAVLFVRGSGRCYEYVIMDAASSARGLRAADASEVLLHLQKLTPDGRRRLEFSLPPPLTQWVLLVFSASSQRKQQELKWH